MKFNGVILYMLYSLQYKILVFILPKGIKIDFNVISRAFSTKRMTAMVTISGIYRDLHEGGGGRNG